MNLLTQFKQTLREYGLEWFKRYYSVYRGFVVDNKDPEFLGRLKITCPAVFGDESFDDWVFPKGIPSGNGWGVYAIPQVGELIWVSFEAGNPADPIWEYGHWNQKQKTPGTNNEIFLFQSPQKQRIEFDDSTGKTRILNKDGYLLEISDKGFHMEKNNVDARKLFDELFTAINNTKTATTLGPQPFINIAEYEALKKKFQELFY